MTPEDRNELKLRWLECERQKQVIHAGREHSRQHRKS